MLRRFSATLDAHLVESQGLVQVASKTSAAAVVAAYVKARTVVNQESY